MQHFATRRDFRQVQAVAMEIMRVNTIVMACDELEDLQTSFSLLNRRQKKIVREIKTELKNIRE